jgi:glycosyltransferase involved in cell wall biosynthesis
MTFLNETREEIDVLLILEGTYPYVRGGVSSWVQQIIAGHPHYRFGILFIGGHENDYKQGMRYELVSNIVYLDHVFLFDGHEELRENQYSEKQHCPHFEKIKSAHDNFDYVSSYDFPPELLSLDYYLDADTGITLEQFLHGEQSWDFLCEKYQASSSEYSFVDYFWTIRNMHRPLWKLARMAKFAPKAKCVHSVSTGYAGFLGALIRQEQSLNYIISEHGIYTKERRIDLLQQQWQNTKSNKDLRIHASYHRKLWIRFFEILAKLAYASAHPIVSLFQGYQSMQILDGASEQNTLIVPNGVNVKALSQLRVQRPQQVPKIMCLIGRVVPIKDIKTFIRSVSIVKHYEPNIQAWIVGPYEEDSEYHEECIQVTQSLDLEENVHFLGMQNLTDILPKIGVMVLSSISEGLPLVILEAFAVGIPVVATDVGACSELLLGKDPEDCALGAAGKIVDIANPEELARASMEVLFNADTWHEMSQVSLKRVEQYYSDTKMLDAYQALYRDAIGG